MAFYAMLTNLECYFNVDGNKIFFFSILFLRQETIRFVHKKNNSSGCVEG